MEIIGRYQMIRPWWVCRDYIGEPLIIDRCRSTIYPYRGTSEFRSEWEPKLERNEAMRKWNRFKSEIANQRTAEHRQRAVDRMLARHSDCQQMAAILGESDYFTRLLFLDVALGTLTTTSLNSAYTAGSAGAAFGARVQFHQSKTINSVYFNIASYTGTAANVNDINLELRPEASAGAATPNTGTLTESKTKDPASATGWIASTGWTTAPAAASRYFVIVADADGNGTDFAVCNRTTAGVLDLGNQPSAGHLTHVMRMFIALTTGGWASGNTASAGVPVFVLGFSDGTAFGNPFTANTTPANNTQQRGLLIGTGGLLATIKIYGMAWIDASTNISGIKIFSGTTAPNGSADHTSTDLLYNTAGGKIGCQTAAGALFTLTAGTQYRIVTTYSASSQGGPRRIDIGTGEDATLRLAMPGAGNFYWTQDDGGSTWGGDLVGSMPNVAIFVDGQVAAAAGGGLFKVGGMTGGMQKG